MKNFITLQVTLKIQMYNRRSFSQEFVALHSLTFYMYFASVRPRVTSVDGVPCSAESWLSVDNGEVRSKKPGLAILLAWFAVYQKGFCYAGLLLG